jgi:tetratricopeptide (TPR) repeat protein
MKLAGHLSAALFGSAVVVTLVQPQVVVAAPATQVATIARQVTVQIEGQNPGSGVIVAKQGQTYYVLTTAHVVATQDEYEIVTPDGKKYPLNYKLVRKFPNVDLALVQFNSPQFYQVVAISSSSQLKADTPMYVSGFPITPGDGGTTTYRFSEGEMGAIGTHPVGQGYALAYLTDTFAGMSGGPILNQKGQLVGIHGASISRFTENQGIDPEAGTKIGLNLGIPVDTFLRLVPNVNPALKFLAAPPLATSSQRTAPDLVIQAADQLIAGKMQEALTTVEEAIRSQPNYASAYLARGIFRAEAEDFRGAIPDYDQAIRLNPDSSFSYHYRGAAHLGLGNFRGAITDFGEAIRLNPTNALTYYGRGLSHFLAGDFREAISDLDEAIRLNPTNAQAYKARGVSRSRIGDYPSALSDLNQAIRLYSGDALAYYSRGSMRLELRDIAGAITDYEKAAELLRPDENSPKRINGLTIKQWYQKATRNAKRLRMIQR